MTGAASRLKVTQPTVSRQIKLLEEELGVELLDRGERVTRPTVQGQIFYEYARQILNLVQRAEAAVRSFSSHLEGSIRVATVNYLGMSLIAPVVSHFLRPGNQFKIDLCYASAEEIIEKMRQSKVDVAVLPHLKDEYGVEFLHYETHSLFQDRMLFVGSRKDTSLPSVINFKDISKKPFVSFSNLFPRFRAYLEEKQKEQGFQLRPIFEVNNLGSLKKVIEEGLYWGFMPAFSIQKQIQYGRLSSIEVKDVEYRVNTSLYCLKELKNKKFIEALILLLKKETHLFQSKN